MTTPTRRWFSSLIVCSLLLNLLPPPFVWAQQPSMDDSDSKQVHQLYLPLIQAQDIPAPNTDTGDEVEPSVNLVVLAAGTALTATACDLYPIAFHTQGLANVAPGTLLTDIYNGSQPGNFGWLSWTGDNGIQSLVTSLTPPGSASTYTNPNDPADHKVSIGDWVRGRPGVANAKAVRTALDRLKTLDITVPVWESVQGNGANAQYQITDFALVRLTDYRLPGQNRISARFLGYNLHCRDNTPPLAADDAYTLDEDTLLTVAAPGLLANDSDLQQQPLHATLVTESAYGLVALNADGSFSYTPFLNFTGQDHFTYQANDGLLNSNIATVVLTINAVNDSPIAHNDSVATDEDIAVLIAVRANDSAGPPDEDPSLTVTAVGAATNGIAKLDVSGDVRYTPAPDFNGTDTFTYTVCDSGKLCADATVTVVIGGVNDPPVAVDDRVTTPEDTPITIDAAANDRDGDGNLAPGTVMTLTNPVRGTLVIAGPGSFTYRPAQNVNGLDSFRYTICDDGTPAGTPLCAAATITIDIQPANDAPSAGADSYSTDEDTPLTVAAPGVLGNDSDVDGDSLTAMVETQPSHGAVALNSDGSFTYTPAADSCGSDSFAYSAHDGYGVRTTAMVTLTVLCINDAPVAQADHYSTAEGTPLTVAAPGLLANDSDVEGDTLVVSNHLLPTAGVLTQNPDGSLTYTPNPGFCGQDSYRYTVIDGKGGSAEAVVTLDIVCTNEPPVAVGDSYTMDAEQTLSVSAPGVLGNDSDPDGDALTAVLVNGPASGVVTFQPQGSFVYTPTIDFDGVDSFTYKATDGNADSNVATVTITVNLPVCVAPPPGMVSWWPGEGNGDDIMGSNHGAPHNGATFAPGKVDQAFSLDGQDDFVQIPDHPSLTPSSITLDAWVKPDTIRGVEPIIAKYNSNNEQLNGVSWAFRTIGSGGLLFGVYQAPSGFTNYRFITTNQPVLTVGLWHHVAATFDITTQAMKIYVNGVAVPTTLDPGSTTVNPIRDSNTPVQIGTFINVFGQHDGFWDGLIDEVELFDRALSTPEIESIYRAGRAGKCKPENVAPIAVNDNYHTNENQALIVAVPGVLTNDSDPNGDPLTAILASNPATGTLTLNPNGSFVYTPTAGFTGVDTFTYKANDGTLDSNISTVTITVNGPPTWIQLFPSGTAPGPRVYLQSGNAYDEATDRLIIFSGGAAAVYPADVWVLVNATEANGKSSWLQLTPEGAAPSGRTLHSAVYDPKSNRLIVFGGCGGNCGPFFNDAWVLTNANGLGGTPTWLQLPSAPLISNGHAAVYDPTSNRMIIFGVGNGSTALGSDGNNVWVLTDANGVGNPTWIQLQPSGSAPPVRSAPAAATYDPTTNRLIVIGGRTANPPDTAYNDVWILTNANGLGGTPQWMQLTPSGTPPNPRGGHSLVYDPTTNRAIVAAGGNGPSTTYYNDVWLLTNANGFGGIPEWVHQTPVGDPPPPRYTHVTGYAVNANRMVIALGQCLIGNTYAHLNDVWILTDANQLYMDGQTPPVLPVSCSRSAPIATDDIFQVNQNATLVVSAPGVLANDNSSNNTPLTAILVTGPVHGTLTLNPTGGFVYTPTIGFNGTDTFTYKANDGTLGSNIATVGITINQAATCLSAPVGMVSWWPGDGDASDDIGRNDGVIHGDTTFIPGQVDQAFVLDGTGDYIEIADSPTLSLNGLLSIDTWIYPLGGSGGLVTKSDNAASGSVHWSFQYDGSGQRVAFSITIKDGTYVRIFSPDSSVPLNTWSHIAATVDGTTMKLFVNGIEVSSDQSPGLAPNRFTLLLGAYQRNGIKEQFFHGYIDEVALFNRSLTAIEVQRIYDASVNGRCKGAPIVWDDHYIIDQDTPLTVPAPGILGNDRDPDGDTLSAVRMSDPLHGALTLSTDGAFTYVPNPGFVGTDSFIYHASDGSFNSAIATVRIFVFSPQCRVGDWPVVPDLTTARYEHVAVLLPDGRVLVTGGTQAINAAGTDLTSTELYNPAINTWLPGTDLSVPRAAATGTLLPDGRVLLVGGEDRATSLASAEIFDPVTNAWTSAASMGTPRAGHTATLLKNGQVLVVGGATSASSDPALSSAEIYDPATNTWLPAASMSAVRHVHTATLLNNGQVLVTGGYSVPHIQASVNSAELYNPETNTWTVLPAMSSPRAVHTAILLNNGRVLITGGEHTASWATSDLFDPATNSWLTVPNMSTPRTRHTASLLPNGQVLVAGGFGADYWNALASVELYDPVTNGWQGVPNLSVARDLHTATQLCNGKILFVGGWNGRGSLSSAELYGLSDAPVAVADTYSVLTGQSVTIMPPGILANDNDTNGDPIIAVLVSNPANGMLTLNPNGSFVYTPTSGFSGTDMFTYKANDGALDSNIVPVTLIVAPSSCTAANWSEVPNLTTPRYEHVTVLLLDGRVLVTGGTQASSAAGTDLISTELYNPATNTWQLGPNLSVPRAAATGTLLPDGRVLIVGGEDRATSLASAEIFDPVTNEWTPVVSMNTARAGHTATLLKNGRVLIVGGAGSVPTAPALSSAEIYDPATNTWQPVTSMSTGRHTHSATLLTNGQVLITGGYFVPHIQGSVSSAELYNPDTNTWTPLSAISSPRAVHTAVLLNNGRVLVTGGEHTTAWATSDLFDPATNSWLTVPNMLTPRTRHTASLLPNGQVLVAGGFGSSYFNPLTSVELYDPATNRWQAAPSLKVARDLHTATQLCNGTILLVGGWSGSNALSSAELYAPPSAPPTAPVATADNYSTLAGQTLTVDTPGVLTNDSDLNGDPLTAIVVNSAAHGAVTLNPNGGFVYTPTVGFIGSDTFTYKANDGQFDSNIATVTITVDSLANLPPVANNDLAGLDEDTVLTIAAPGVLGNDNDPNGKPLTAVLVSNPAHGKLTLNVDGSYVYTPTIDFHGADSFTYRANNGQRDSNVATVNLTIASVNDAPVAVGYATTMPEDHFMVCPAPCLLGRVYDFDRDPLTVKVGDPPDHGTLDLRATGALTYTPYANFTGVDTFTFIANDGQIDSNTATITITVLPATDQPIVVNDSYTVNKDTTLTVPAPGVLANDSDPDGGVLTASLLSGPAYGTVKLEVNGSFAYTPTAGYSGTDHFVYRARNANLFSAETLVTITVGGAPNQPPVAGNDAYNVTSNQSLTVAAPGLLANDNDPNGDTTTAVLVSNPANGTLTLKPNGAFVYTPTVGFSGTDTFTYKASDGVLDSNVATVTLTVGGTNRAPIANADSFAINAGQTLNVNAPGVLVNDSDPDGDTLTALLVQTVAHGVLTLNANGSFSYTPATGFSGSDSFTYKANDGALDSTVVAVTITVRPVINDTTPPTVAITAPTDDVTITTLTDLIGTATDANFDYFVVEIAPVGQSTFTPIINSTTPVVDGKLGTLDPTLLVNDLYTVRLTAFDLAGNNASIAITVQLAGNQKIGNFTVAFEDLTIGTSCLPLNINRVYDSRDRTPGDFGMGWRLDIQTLRLRENQTMGSSWFVDLVDEPGPFGILIPTYSLLDTGVHKVSLTLPDGHVEEFDLTPSPSRSQFSPILAVTPAYTARPGTVGSLTPEGETTLVILDGQPGAVDLLYESDLTRFDPQIYRYTAPDGTIYRIDKFAGLQSIECTTGAKLTFGPNGIVHSTGQGLTLVRDAQNRIIEVSDPNGNVLRYAYDAAGNLISFTDAAGNVTHFTYNAQHYLLEIIDPRGVQGIRNEYDANGRLIGHTDANGKQISYTHDLVAKTETVTDRRGNRTVYEYDDRGNVLRQTDALGNVTTYTYDAFDNELTVTDPLGNTTTRTYDLRRNVLTEIDPLGNVTRFTYTARDNVRTLTDALGRAATYDYDGPGYLIRTTDALGNVTRNHYDTGGIVIPGTWNLLSTTDALGNVTNYAYDNNGRVTKEIDALGYATIYTYDANGNRLTESMTRTTDSGIVTVVTSFAYDALNRLIKTTYPDGSTTQTEYNAIGQQSATIDQLGRRTSYDYDQAGRLVKTTYPDGFFESSTYDEEGNRLSAADRAGRTTTFEYDVLNRLTRTVYPDGSATSSSYDAAGRLVSTTDERGNTTRYEYDKAGRRTKVIDAQGHEMTFTYDANGNQRTMTDANSNTVTYEYDALNRRTRTLFADGSSTVTAYDAVGRRIAETDQANKITRFSYDALGRLISVTDALNQVTRYSYDERGNQLTQTDANDHTTSFGYDEMGRRVRRTLPIGMVERYGYDAAGNLISKTDFNGKTTTYAYDDLNRLLSRTPDPSLNQPTVRFAYFLSGQRQRMEDAGGITTYTYDQRDRLLSKATPWGTLNYTYDAAGNLLSIRSSNANGVNVTYSYDQLNRLVALDDQNLTNGVTTYAYDNAGNLISYRYPNFVQHDYTYDQLNRLTNLNVHKGFAPLASYAYTLSATGNRLAVSELSGRTVTYAYDDLYRLTGETIANDPNGINGAIGYRYDPVGNRLARTSTVAPVPAATYGYDANDRLLSDSYDANGNTTASAGRSYAYDFENRLINFNNSEVTMLYDGDGNRVAKTVSGVTTHYLVDDHNLTGYTQVLEETVGGVVQRQYSYGLDLVSQRQVIGGVREVSFYGYDGHGSVRFLIENEGNVTDQQSYDAFGNLIVNIGTTPNIYTYSGEQFDPNIAFSYLRARYYQSTTGRFATSDPFLGLVHDPISLHKYLYTRANPINYHDPTGKFSLTEMLVVSSIIGLLTASYTGLRVAYRGGSTQDVLVAEASGFIIGFSAGLIAYGGAWGIRLISPLIIGSATTGLPQNLAERVVSNVNKLQHSFRHVSSDWGLGSWNLVSGAAFREIVRHTVTNPHFVYRGWQMSQGAQIVDLYLVRMDATKWFAVYVAPGTTSLITSTIPSIMQLIQWGVIP